MNKKLLLALIFPALFLGFTFTAKSQNNVTALMNVLETLQFLKDMKENKTKLEPIVKEIKTKYKETDPTYIKLRDEYVVVKLAADNILNNLVIDLMDKDKRKLFRDRPNMINDYYKEHVQVYNKSMTDFNAAYQESKGADAGIFDVLKKIAGLLIGDLTEVVRRIAIEVLVEKLKAPYQMKSWTEI